MLLVVVFLSFIIISLSLLTPAFNSLDYRYSRISLSPLHVVGNKIVDANSNVVILRGVVYSYFIDSPNGSWTLPDGEIEWNTWDPVAVNSNLEAIQSWGCNTVRVVVTLQWWIDNTNNFRSNLESFISCAASHQLYVDLTFWRVTADEGQVSLPYPPYDNNSLVTSVAGFVDVWQGLAATLKSYPNVMFELWNEPVGDITAEESWFNTTQLCINAIRGTGATNLIVSQWDYGIYLDFMNYSLTPTSISSMDWANPSPLKDPLNNIVYSTHLYSDDFFDTTSGYAPKYSYSDMLWAFNITGLFSLASQHPVWIGEIGCNLWATNMTDEYAWYSNTLTILNQYGIGYCGWAWPPWTTGTEWGLVSGQPNYAPDQAGQILQNMISEP